MADDRLRKLEREAAQDPQVEVYLQRERCRAGQHCGCSPSAAPEGTQIGSCSVEASADDYEDGVTEFSFWIHGTSKAGPGALAEWLKATWFYGVASDPRCEVKERQPRREVQPFGNWPVPAAPPGATTISDPEVRGTNWQTERLPNGQLADFRVEPDETTLRRGFSMPLREDGESP